MRYLILSLLLTGCGDMAYDFSASSPDHMSREPVSLCVTLTESATSANLVASIDAAADNWGLNLELCDDGKRTVDVRRLTGEYASALAIAHYSRCSGGTCDADSMGITVNSRYASKMRSGDCSRGYDLTVVLTHEIGHLGGLDDDKRSELMHPDATKCSSAAPTEEEARAVRIHLAGF